jgi:hypothetical protein
MTLILEDASLDRRQFRHLMPLWNAARLRLLQLGRQNMSTALALRGQDVPNLIDSLRGNQGAMRSPVPGLSARLSPAFLSSGPQARLTG